MHIFTRWVQSLAAMKTIQQKKSHLYKHSLSGFKQMLLGMIMLFMLTATACHLPLAAAGEPGSPAYRQTEAAGILNPPGLDEIQDKTNNTPAPIYVAPPGPAIQSVNDRLVYTTQQGDTLSALALRFVTPTHQIQSDVDLLAFGLLPIGIQVSFPDNIETMLPHHTPILPDSEVIYGPSVGSFDAEFYASAAGGYLSQYTELLRGQMLTGPQIIRLVAIETSTNPRLLLAFLEYRSGWVSGHPAGAENDRYPIGYNAPSDWGLYNELMITARLLAQGYYGWRDGSRLHVRFEDKSSGRLSPGLNAGSTALMTLFGALYTQDVWERDLISPGGFLTFYEEMFGDFWSRAAGVEPYMLTSTPQPGLALPFAPGERWSLTGGPHIAWQTGTPRGALDFAPITGETRCSVSSRWATAAASGLVVRTAHNVVALDLDGDGDEGTGWVLVYMHMAEDGMAQQGNWLEKDMPVGHPSCEGGQSSGTHLHLARKFNGEWLGVDEPFPMILSGWRTVAGGSNYGGYLQKGEQIVTSRPDGSSGSTIIREE